MSGAQNLKRRLQQSIDGQAERLIALGDRILSQPELGFKEYRTAALMSDFFSGLGLAHRTGLAITGVKAVLDSGRPGPSVAVLGELDSVLVWGHPQADQQTGAAHACGHNAQLAALAAVAAALVETGAMSELVGRVVLMAVPAEEYVEVEYRMGLKREGKIEFLGGKPELVRLGEFDDVDMAMMFHTSARAEDGLLSLASSFNGCLVKSIEYIGRAAHAGGAPHVGINALNAAMLGMNAINANRETFRDQDGVRVHPIITRGGDLVNVVPADVRLETFVRGRTMEAILAADTKVDRALKAGALGVGAKVRITTIPGYMPYNGDATLARLVKDNAIALVGADHWSEVGHQAGSTDMGDISQIMPAIHPYAGGARGSGHGADFEIFDREAAYLNPAKVMAMMLVDLLGGDGEGARRVLANMSPKLSKERYLQLAREIDRVDEFDGACH